MSDQNVDGGNTSSIPRDLADRAVRSGGGEYAWRLADAIACSEALGAAGQAVLGGEVWLVDDEGEINALLAAEDGGPPGVHHWEVSPEWDEGTETWVAFCDRAAAYTVSVLRGMNIEQDLASKWWPHVRYCLAWVSEDDYRTLVTLAPGRSN